MKATCGIWRAGKMKYHAAVITVTSLRSSERCIMTHARYILTFVSNAGLNESASSMYFHGLSGVVEVDFL